MWTATRTLSQSVQKWRKIYLSPFIVPRRGLNSSLNRMRSWLVWAIIATDQYLLTIFMNTSSLAKVLISLVISLSSFYTILSFYITVKATLIRLETTGIDNNIFSSEPLSIAGSWLGVCHGWFHLHGLTRAARSELFRFQVKFVCNYVL